MESHQEELFPSEPLNVNLPTRTSTITDWGEASEYFDSVKSYIESKDLTDSNEAQTRYDVIDRIVRDVLGWSHGQVSVEEPNVGDRYGFVDYILRNGDTVIVIEAKRIGSTFPSVTKKRTLKLNGTVLTQDSIKKALDQAEYYARDKEADIVVVTNGLCWIFYPPSFRNNKSYATLLFPFDKDGDAEQLFDFFSAQGVEKGSLRQILDQTSLVENRLLDIVENADGRVDRNNIADFIVPALNRALYKNAILENTQSLKRCYVTTEARAKFDNTLQMHLADTKPKLGPLEKIDRTKSPDQLGQIIDRSMPSKSSPVTIIIGAVGVGKTTYLKHFELVSGLTTILEDKIHWIYVDFAQMGTGASPRNFLYQKLKSYIETDHLDNPTDWNSLIQPAYKEIIESYQRGQYYQYFIRDKDKFWEKVTERIEKDANSVEPYVNRLFSYLATQQLCIVVLDNVDLFENEDLETSVFSEGLAFSETTHANVIISLRDATFVRHQSDSVFNAYQLRKLWLKAPDFKEVLSSRLSYAKIILQDRPAKIPLNNNMILDVPDLSVFFDVVQGSLLNQEAGSFIENMTNNNIRKGLELVTDFLTSGHIQADKAIGNYLEGKNTFIFQFHEVFKGTVLGQWKYYQEKKSSHCLNLFDARLSSQQLRLLRLHLIQYLWLQSRQGQSEVIVNDCYRLFSKLGASENHIITCLKDMEKYGLIRSVTAETITLDKAIVLTRTGGYYLKVLSRKFVYAESCIFDTAIGEEDAWHEISSLTRTIELQTNVYERMKNRKVRIDLFCDYLENLEQKIFSDFEEFSDLLVISDISNEVKNEVNIALDRSKAIIRRRGNH